MFSLQQSERGISKRRKRSQNDVDEAGRGCGASWRAVSRISLLCQKLIRGQKETTWWMAASFPTAVEPTPVLVTVCLIAGTDSPTKATRGRSFCFWLTLCRCRLPLQGIHEDKRMRSWSQYICSQEAEIDTRSSAPLFHCTNSVLQHLGKGL